MESAQWRRDAFERIWDSQPGLLGVIREVNNIPIARRYMTVGFIFFLIGGALAALMRIQLGTPENTFLDPETYNMIFTMHGTTMMFLFVIPFIEAIANYILPLALGTRDMPFPRLTALSFWTYVFGGIFLYSSFIFGVAPDGSWTAYLPLNSREYSPGINMDFWDIGLSVAEISAMGAAAELIVAVLRMRAPGMRMWRVPLFAWAMLITAFMIIFGFTPLIVGTALLELDRKGITSFFIPAAGGEPLLWQHLFWVFGHPEVYIMFVPAVGIISHVVQTMSRRPMVSYTLQVAAMVATGFLSFGLWVHHMFTAELPPTALGFFTAASMAIAIPNGVQMFGWIATLWLGRPVWRMPLLFVLGFIVIFVIGGVTGVMVAAVPFDTQVHDTYFVVAHFHYVLIGGVVFPLFAGLYYWLPKITGRMMSERLGRWNFWMMFGFFNVAFFPMHISGLLGMPRRVYTYPEGMSLEIPNLISSIGAFGFATGVLLFVANVVWSSRRGVIAGDNPWDADGLEWSEASPPPNAQFREVPVVTSRHPMWKQTTLSAEGTEWADVLRPLANGPTRWRGALIVTAIDAEPHAVAHIPSSSIAPFTMAVGFVLIFIGALLESFASFAAGAVLTFVALVLWFRPQTTENIAIEEMGTTSDESRLPLATAGPMSNGYWGTMVFLLVLTTAFVTVAAGYFYLGEGPHSWPPPRELESQLLLPVVAAGFALAAGIMAWRTARSVESDRFAATRTNLAVTWLCVAGFLLISSVLYARLDLEPATSAYGSAYLSVIGFEWLVAAVLLAMLTAAQLWAWLAPHDRRGDAVALNSSLVGYFMAVSGILALAILHVSPRLW